MLNFIKNILKAGSITFIALQLGACSNSPQSQAMMGELNSVSNIMAAIPMPHGAANAHHQSSHSSSRMNCTTHKTANGYTKDCSGSGSSSSAGISFGG